jgi:hypothetical protein
LLATIVAHPALTTAAPLVALEAGAPVEQSRTSTLSGSSRSSMRRRSRQRFVD